MVISLFMLIAILITVIRTFFFGVWCFKNKNIIGGISVLFLIICVVAGGGILLL